MGAEVDFEAIEIVPPGREGLACSCLRPKGWVQPPLPPDEPNFDDPAYAMPLTVIMAPYGVVVYTISVRPAYAEGTVQDWLLYLCGQEHFEVEGLEETELNGLPALLAEARQTTDAGPMRMRFIALEDGGRFYTGTVMAPEAIWPSVEEVLNTLLWSFRLAAVQGPTVPLSPPPPAEST
ncbi:MAG: hypothetical protein FJ291_24060 [Planctomycetes bacterium]|nr:hypothetical protein [Planctomycetota bacterium]